MKKPETTGQQGDSITDAYTQHESAIKRFIAKFLPRPNDIEDVSLKERREHLKQFIPEEARQYFIENNEETHIHFPVKKYPEKLKTLNLDKTPAYEGVLKGIKGQYLLFEDDTVFNVRSWEGYVIRLEIL